MGCQADAAAKPMHHHHRTHVAPAAAGTASAQSGGGTPASGSVAANSSNSSAAPAHRKVVHHHYSSEGSMAIYSGPWHMHDRPWMLKHVRMVAVAIHFLKNGVPKVNLSLQQPALNGVPDRTIKVVIMPKLEDFNPQMNATAAR